MLKNESQLRADYGAQVAAYAMKARHLCERIDAYLAREQAAYIVAVKAGRFATAAHIRAKVDPWIVRQARVRFHLDLVLSRAYLSRRHNIGSLFVVHGGAN